MTARARRFLQSPRWREAPALATALAVALLLAVPGARAQLGGAVPVPSKLVRAFVSPLRLPAGGSAEAIVALHVLSEWHITANPPASENAIPTTVEIAAARGVSAGTPIYPAPRVVKLSFDEQPQWVYDGQSIVRVPLAAAPNAIHGAHTLKGRVRFQACNDQICLPPAEVPFEVMVEVTEPAAGAPPAGTMPPPGAAVPSPAHGFVTAPPSRAAPAAAAGPLAGVLERGGWAAFLTLFLIGLALNLTPCVYPMIGVTVSIFGARRAAPPLQVFGAALLYVLGIGVMYSALGVIAAITGGLFGGLLQHPVVLVGIGLLLVALSLSMFGLYEIQLPPALLARLGGAHATGAAGILASGLLVGIFAAPCTGPPVVALLAVVGARGDPWYGFRSFFTLAMGLGAPYLVLGTFSNLLQRLPRSGEWLVWVKKVFGVLLLAVGLLYALLGVAPKWSGWVAPAALVLGGLYLGFVDRSAAARRGFRVVRWVGGALAVVLGLAMVALQPAKGLAFEELKGDADLTGSRVGGHDTPTLIDFSADWCLPCHELDKVTFTDRRVIEAARRFRRFKVDLTRYNSAEAERWRQEYGIAGVPTVVFLEPNGAEVREARVEGFLPPAAFVERLRLAEARIEQAGGRQMPASGQ